MNHKGIPCCYYPTTVILVDDDRNFAKNLRLAAKRHFPCIVFQDPEVALKFIQARHPDPFIKRCLQQTEEFKADERNIKVNIHAIHKEIFNPNRHKEISIVVVDYQMPNMDGIEFCKRLADREHIKKIMLTGEADHGLAVTAFNNGLIDKFIKKDEVGNINELVCHAVKELQYEYFLELSAPIINSLRNSPEKMSAALKDLGFANWFYSFLNQQQMTEFYLLENQANFLLLDRSDKFGWLVVREAQEMDDLIESASDLYSEEPTDEAYANLEKIKSKNYLPLFYSKQDYQATIDEWSAYLHRCNVLKTEKNTYYWAYIEGPSVYGLESTQLQFFNSCLDA
ncbi:MAG: Response regulator containing a CheY-like receiver domain and an domain [Gammaproteobacteria bacterium]|jgi:DNA-binding NarL/FixJ family response regulator|nr:Response regulator containing a CheY-like receiver domain and an domain [Gammaproteobacteria bacterium]